MTNARGHRRPSWPVRWKEWFGLAEPTGGLDTRVPTWVGHRAVQVFGVLLLALWTTNLVLAIRDDDGVLQIFGKAGFVLLGLSLLERSRRARRLRRSARPS